MWNRIPDEIREDVVEFALEHEDLTPRELAVKYTDEKQYFVSESSAYRILKAADLITAPAHVVIRAADEFRDKTTRPNELWQTDFTYLKVIGWGWFYLSTILDDHSRYIVAWKLCTTMKASDVTETLELALEASGCDEVTVVHKPRLLSDNGSSYVAGDLADFLDDKRHGSRPGRAAPSTDPRQDRALASDHEEPRPAGKLLTCPAIWNGRSKPSSIYYNNQPIPREPWQPDARRRLPRPRRADPVNERGDQETDHPETPLAASERCRIISNGNRTGTLATRNLAISEIL